MSSLLALVPEPSTPAWDPLPTAPRTAGERFRLDLEAQLATGNFASEERNLRRAFAEAQRRMAEAGETVENPYEAGRWTGDFVQDLPRLLDRVTPPTPVELIAPSRSRIMASDEERRRREEAWDAAVERIRAQRPDEADQFPTAAELRQRAREQALQAEREARLPEGLGGGLGAFAGRMAGVFADPVQWLTLPFGVWRTGGPLLAQVARTAATEGALAGAAQALVETRAGPYRQSLGLEPDSAEQIGMAILGGAVLGGSARAVLGGIDWLRGRRATEDRPSAAQTDQARPIAEAQAMAEASLPAPELVPAHEQAAASAQLALATGQRPASSLPAPVAPAKIAQSLARLEPDALRAHVRNVVEDVMASQGVRLDGAWRSDLGAITIEWGSPGDPLRQFRGGYGLSHIIAHRNAQGINGEAWVRDALPEVLLHGVTTRLRGPPDGLRVDLEWQGHRVVLALHRFGQRENWVLSGFPPERGPDGTGGGNPQPSYAPAPSVLRPPEGAGPRREDIAPAARRFNAYAPTGRAVLVEPRVVSLRQLVPSHDPEGRPNPAYPHAEGLQPRDRAAAPSQDQVRAIAARLIPERLLPSPEAGAGAPIIGPDMVVESGNGRIAALMLVHRDPALAAQREAYLAALRRAGFDIEGIKEPVLVSARVSQLTAAERAAFVREANLRATLAEPAAEVAKRDVAAVREALALWRGGEVRHAANQEFREAFVARLTPEERGALLRADGSWNAELVQRLERALLMAAYGDAFGPLAARLVEGETEGIRSLAGALRQAAGDWAAMRRLIERGSVPAGYDGTAALAEAVGAILEAQRRRLPLDQLVLQVDLERPPLTDGGMAMLKAMFPDGDLGRRIKPEVRLAELLRGYAARARQAEGGSMLIDLPPVRAADLAEVARRAEEADPALGPRETPPGEPQAGEAADPRATRLVAAEAERARLAALPETARAELLEAQRIAAERDIAVPDEAGEIGARALLDAADREAEELAAAAACLTGAAA